MKEFTGTMMKAFAGISPIHPGKEAAGSNEVSPRETRIRRSRPKGN
jgi:hypothetical protein